MLSRVRSVRTKLLLSVVLANLFVAIALGVAIYSNHKVAVGFSRFIDHDQALLMAYMEMYAQGLQGGQALRTIVLDPSNRRAYETLDKANKAFEEAYAKSTLLAAADTKLTAVLSEIHSHWQQVGKERDRVLELAQTDYRASRRKPTLDVPLSRGERG